MDEEKSIFRLNIDTFTIWFIGKNDITRIERAWNNEPMQLDETKPGNRVDVFRRHIDKFLKNGFFEAEQLDIVRLSFEPSEHWRIKCSKFLLISPGTPPQWILNWMSKVESKLKQLAAHNWSLEGIGEYVVKLNVTETLELVDNADLTDEQFEQITATNLLIRCPAASPASVKNAFENHLINGRPGDEFLFCTDFPEGFDHMELLPRDVTVERMDCASPAVKLFRITGGFRNRHGNQAIRICRYTNSTFEVSEEPKKNREHQYILWPFTLYR